MVEKQLLVMHGICKAFPGVQALDNAHLDVKRGEVHALLGENGAGKSTLIKILAGIYPMDAGEIRIDDQPVAVTSVRDAKDLGISVIHQEISLVPRLNVADNIMLGAEGSVFFIDFKSRRKAAETAMRELGFDIDIAAKVGSLSIAQQQIVEIVRALATHGARLIVMDEPTASISEKDAKKLFATIDRLKAGGIGIVYISHRMDEVKMVADRITVFRDGKHVGTREAREVGMDEIVEMMIGRRVEKMYHYDITSVGERIIELRNIANRSLKNVDFDLRKGEVHGLYGLVGSGRTELSRALFGLDGHTGDILLNGEKAAIASPRDAMRYGIAMVPEDRKSEGLFLSHSIRFNSTITILDRFMRLFSIRNQVANQILDDYRGKLKTKYSSASHKVSTLSGGNQQKVVLTKWLATHPAVLILDEPTRGIDVGAKSEIYELIFQLTQEGVSIILISSELPEILNLCTRVSVMRDGELVKTIDRDDFSQELIFKYAMHKNFS